MAKSHCTTSLLGNVALSFLVGEEAGQYCSGHVCGPVGNGVGEGVGGGVTASVGLDVGAEVGGSVGFTGEGVGGHVKVVSHTVFVVNTPLHFPLLLGLPELGSH